MATNIASLVGQTLTTRRALTVDASGLSYEARRRNPQPSDRLMPAGTSITALQVQGGRLVAQTEDFGVVFLHANHLPESGTTYGTPAAAKPVQDAISNDPEIAAMQARIQELKAAKQAAAAQQAREAKLAALKQQLEALELEALA